MSEVNQIHSWFGDSVLLEGWIHVSHFLDFFSIWPYICCQKHHSFTRQHLKQQRRVEGKGRFSLYTFHFKEEKNFLQDLQETSPYIKLYEIGLVSPQGLLLTKRKCNFLGWLGPIMILFLSIWTKLKYSYQEDRGYRMSVDDIITWSLTPSARSPRELPLMLPSL